MDINKIAIISTSLKEGKEIIKWFLKQGATNKNSLTGGIGAYYVIDGKLCFSTKAPSNKIITAIPDEFIFGEHVLALTSYGNVWTKKIYLATIDQCESPFICCDIINENTIANGKKIPSYSGYKYIKKLSQKLEITVTLNGKEIPLSDISEETLLNLRKNS